MIQTYQEALTYFEGNSEEDLKAEYEHKRNTPSAVGHYDAGRLGYEPWLIHEAQVSEFEIAYGL